MEGLRYLGGRGEREVEVEGGALGPSCAVANGSFGGSPCALSHLSCAHTRPGQTER